MIGKECTYKRSKIRGTIRKKLGRTKAFSPQWGVYWHTTNVKYNLLQRAIDYFRTDKRNLTGCPPYWNNKIDIKVLNPT